MGSGSSVELVDMFAGGDSPGDVDTIDFVTIASTGNAIDFGDLTIRRGRRRFKSYNSRNHYFGGESNHGLIKYELNMLQSQSTGNAIDFGDLTVARQTVCKWLHHQLELLLVVDIHLHRFKLM